MSRIWKFFGSGSKILEQGRLRQLKMWLQPPLPSTRAPNLEYPRAPKIRLWMVHCICTCNTQIWHFVLVTLLPTGRSRVSKKFSSRSYSKTSWPPLNIASSSASLIKVVNASAESIMQFQSRWHRWQLLSNCWTLTAHDWGMLPLWNACDATMLNLFPRFSRCSLLGTACVKWPANLCCQLATGLMMLNR